MFICNALCLFSDQFRMDPNLVYWFHTLKNENVRLKTTVQQLNVRIANLRQSNGTTVKQLNDRIAYLEDLNQKQAQQIAQSGLQHRVAQRSQESQTDGSKAVKSEQTDFYAFTHWHKEFKDLSSKQKERRLINVKTKVEQFIKDQYGEEYLEACFPKSSNDKKYELAVQVVAVKDIHRIPFRAIDALRDIPSFNHIPSSWLLRKASAAASEYISLVPIHPANKVIFFLFNV